MKKIAILYHANCSDGFGGAYVAWRKFGKRAAYFPVEHQAPPPKIEGAEIFMIDFCYSAEILKELKSQNKSIVVLDHHISAFPEMKEANEYVFDNNHSGSVIAWKYFFGNQKVPEILNYIEDTDLWKFKLKNSKEIFAALSLVPFEFKAWDKVVKNFSKRDFKKNFITAGKTINLYQDHLIKRLISRATFVLFEGKKILALNSPILISELGNQLVSIYPPFSLVWSKTGDTINVSLRSLGNFDVSQIAKKYGGGGHKNAAGFSFIFQGYFPWVETKEKMKIYK